MSSISRNAIEQAISLLDIIEIQDDRYEMNILI